MVCPPSSYLPEAEEDKGGVGWLHEISLYYGRRVSSKIFLMEITVLGTCAVLGVEFHLANIYKNYCPKLYFVYYLGLNLA